MKTTGFHQEIFFRMQNTFNPFMQNVKKMIKLMLKILQWFSFVQKNIIDF